MSFTPAPSQALVQGPGIKNDATIEGQSGMLVNVLLLSTQAEANTLMIQVGGVKVVEWAPPAPSTLFFASTEARRIYNITTLDGTQLFAGFLLNDRQGMDSSGSWDLTTPDNPVWKFSAPTPTPAPSPSPNPVGGPVDWNTLEQMFAQAAQSNPTAPMNQQQGNALFTAVAAVAANVAAIYQNTLPAQSKSATQVKGYKYYLSKNVVPK